MHDWSTMHAAWGKPAIDHLRDLGTGDHAVYGMSGDGLAKDGGALVLVVAKGAAGKNLLNFIERGGMLRGLTPESK